MNFIQEIQKGELNGFKEKVKNWLELDEQINELNKKSRELKKKRDKELEPEITKFMITFNISDLNKESFNKILEFSSNLNLNLDDCLYDKNIGLIFNGVKTGGSSYWKYGYSYRYSYQYKYNFGYGYGYEEETNL